MKNAPSDFELLILLVEKLKEFTYEELQKKAKKIQNKYRLFQEYFHNSEDIEGVESLRLSFHFKVLYEMGYIKRNGTQYVVSPKCKEEHKKIRNTYPDSTSINSLIAMRLH